MSSQIPFAAVAITVFFTSGWNVLADERAGIVAIANEDIEKQETTFNARLKEIGTPVTILNSNYIRALNGERDRQRAAGNLRGIELIDEEIKLVEANTPLGEMLSTPEIPEVARLRDIFVKQRQQLDSSILPEKSRAYAVHIGQLEGSVNVLTRAGDLAEARKLQARVDSLQNVLDEWLHEQRIINNLNSADDSGMIEVDGLTSKGVRTFRIGIHEINWIEWRKIREWATRNGYDLDDVGEGLSDLHPVTHVSWHDAVKWCNAWSEMAGLQPAYEANGEVYRQGVVLNPNFNPRANGYRLPTQDEWRHAATGGRQSQNFAYSGGNRLDDVAWHKGNSNRKPHPVGMKKPNELGIHDMTGNVWEWAWDKSSVAEDRIFCGGSFFNDASDSGVHRRFRNTETKRSSHTGLRVARNGRN